MAYLSKQKGFTLVEVLVTLSIFGVVLTGTTASLISSLDTERAVKNNFIASGLAQEGFEIVRNIRDSGFLGSSGLPDGSGIYRVQWDDLVLDKPADPGSSCASTTPDMTPASELTLSEDTNGLWGYSSGQPTVFKRVVCIEPIITPGSTPPVVIGKDIKVKVSWTEKSAKKSLTAETQLFNWY